MVPQFIVKEWNGCCKNGTKEKFRLNMIDLRVPRHRQVLMLAFLIALQPHLLKYLLLHRLLELFHHLPKLLIPHFYQHNIQLLEKDHEYLLVQVKYHLKQQNLLFYQFLMSLILFLHPKLLLLQL